MRMAIVPAAALGIIIGTNSGETARSPPSSHALHSASSPSAQALGLEAVERRLGDRLLGRVHGQLREAVGAAGLLARHRGLGIEAGARTGPVLDA
jgi:hypothetical protein